MRSAYELVGLLEELERFQKKATTGINAEVGNHLHLAYVALEQQAKDAALKTVREAPRAMPA